MRNFNLQPITVIFLASMLFSIQVAPIPAYASESSPCPFAWNQNLKIGSRGDGVMKLQQFLNLDVDTQVATSDAGSPGNENTYFGALTKKAVIKFQEKYSTETLTPVGLEKGSGFVGALTRSKLNSLCSAVTMSTSPAVTSTLSVAENQSASVATAVGNSLTVSTADQPAPTLAPAGAGGIPFTAFTLTAGSEDVTVKSVTVERVGIGADGAFDSVALADEDENQIGEERRILSNHKINLNEPFVIPANESRVYKITGNMVSDLTSYDGQMPSFQITAIDASAPVVGSLPIRGTAHTVNSNLVIGIAYAYLSQYDPGSAITRYVNDRGVKFSGIRLTADAREDLSLSWIGWDQAGSAGPADLANVVTVINDVAYPTTIDKKTYASVIDPPVIIPKGNSVDVYIQGDLANGASNRNVKFNIRKSGNIALLGNTYGFYVLIYTGGNTDVSGDSIFTTSDGTTDGDEIRPFFSGSVTTVNGGTFSTIDKSK